MAAEQCLDANSSVTAAEQCSDANNSVGGVDAHPPDPPPRALLSVSAGSLPDSVRWKRNEWVFSNAKQTTGVVKNAVQEDQKVMAAQEGQDTC